MDKAAHFVAVNEIVEARSQTFIDLGFKPLDALHLASAEFAAVDYLRTCDDRLLRKALNMADLAIKVISPVTLIKEISL